MLNNGFYLEYLALPANFSDGRVAPQAPPAHPLVIEEGCQKECFTHPVTVPRRWDCWIRYQRGFLVLLLRIVLFLQPCIIRNEES